MSPSPPFDLSQSHRFFSADCFNRAWGLIEKPERTPEEDEQMLLLSLASLWHWTQREDCTSRSLSIGYWQASRVSVLLGQADSATRYGELCLRHSEGEPPFYQGYAHEALARAATVAEDAGRAAHHLGQARRLADAVSDPDERAMLEKDLESL